MGRAKDVPMTGGRIVLVLIVGLSAHACSKNSPKEAVSDQRKEASPDPATSATAGAPKNEPAEHPPPAVAFEVTAESIGRTIRAFTPVDARTLQKTFPNCVVTEGSYQPEGVAARMVKVACFGPPELELFGSVGNPTRLETVVIRPSAVANSLLPTYPLPTLAQAKKRGARCGVFPTDSGRGVGPNTPACTIPGQAYLTFVFPSDDADARLQHVEWSPPR